VALAGGCATAPPPPTRLVVHVDRLAAERVQAFEAARIRFVEVLRRAGKSDHRGLYLKVGPSTYYSVLTFGAWADLDKLRQERMRTLGQVPKEVVDVYDRESDQSLVFPHASEVWVEQPALSYLPTGRRLVDAVQVVIEDVKPTAENEYEAIWKQIAAVLAQLKYPVERRTYFSSYGSGRMVSFWMAPSVVVAKTAPTLKQVLTDALGADKATALIERWRACVVGSQELDVEAKPEMTSY
jgi:hypothetical protein